MNELSHFSERDSDKPRKIAFNKKNSWWYCCSSSEESSKCRIS